VKCDEDQQPWLLTMVLAAPVFALASVPLDDPVNCLVTGVGITCKGGWI
jgi:hypothetical protein